LAAAYFLTEGHDRTNRLFSNSFSIYLKRSDFYSSGEIRINILNNLAKSHSYIALIKTHSISVTSEFEKGKSAPILNN
jgi:hypothetical protein